MENILLAAGEGHAENELLSQILFYIHENYKKDITLSKIATTFGYSQSYISRYFKNCLEIGIGQYITIIRLKNCIMLMQENKHSITYCAMESGFNSLRTFYRVFYKEFGITPKKYINDKPLAAK